MIIVQVAKIADGILANMFLSAFLGLFMNRDIVESKKAARNKRREKRTRDIKAVILTQ